MQALHCFLKKLNYNVLESKRETNMIPSPEKVASPALPPPEVMIKIMTQYDSIRGWLTYANGTTLLNYTYIH